jgi:hypothetical protein
MAPFSSRAKRLLTLRIFSLDLQYNRCSFPFDKRNLIGISISCSPFDCCWLTSTGGVAVFVEDDSVPLESAWDFCFRRCFFISRTIGLWPPPPPDDDFTDARCVDELWLSRKSRSRSAAAVAARSRSLAPDSLSLTDDCSPSIKFVGGDKTYAGIW